MAKYSEYKDSGQQWLGMVPSHWKVDKISAHFQERKTIVSDVDFRPLSVTKSGVVPQLNTAAKSDNGDNRKLVKKGDFVVNSRSDRKGSCGFSELDGSVSVIYIVTTPIDVNGKFYHYLFRSNDYVEEFYRNGHGIVADLWTTRYDEMKNIQIPIPNKEEQDAIVTYLDKVTADIDKAIAAKERIISSLEERRKIIITHAVTRGINPETPMKDSGIDWLGEIPAHWEIKPIKRLASLTLGKMLDSSNIPSFSIMRPYVCAKDVHFDGVNLSDLREMPFTIEEERKFQIKNGDLLVVEGGAAGTCAIVKDVDQCICAQKTLIIARCNEKALNQYLAYILYICVKFGVIENICNKSTFLHFTKEKMAALQVPVPTIDEQSLIVETILKELYPIDSAISQQKKLIDLLRERKNIIINETVTGKVKVI